jgi:outer membrane scaffolding protein for murein synthesis (MipA/OmpV family)
MNLSLLKTARSVSSVVCIAALGASFSGHADQKPLWEAGLGIGAVTFPDYRGSDRTQTYVLPVPYFVYRGEFLKADRNGFRGRFFDSDRVELNVTMTASPPVDSRHNAARQGMPDLKPTVEIGPSLDLNLWRSGDKRTKLDLRLPLMTGVTIEGSPQSTGWQFSPRANLDLQDPGGMAGWNLGLVAGPLFGDRKQHQYFYSVAPQFATPERPAFEARGGYAGAQFLAALSKRFPSYWVGGFLRYDSLSGAVFGDSPLVKRNSYVAGGIGIAWIFGEASRMVDVTD